MGHFCNVLTRGKRAGILKAKISKLPFGASVCDQKEIVPKMSGIAVVLIILVLGSTSILVVL